MRIFVTGAAGFIGSSLADRLLDRGDYVMGVDNFDPFYDRKLKENNIKNALLNPDFIFAEGDIRDAAFIDRHLVGFKPDVIVHLAAKAGVRPSLFNPQEYYDVNVMGTLNILEAMRKNGFNRMIFASSSSVYGNNIKVPFSEADNVDSPISPYAASKKAGELMCNTYNHLYGFDIFCLRFFTVYGPRQRPDLAINKFTRAILRGEPISVYGDGSSRRDYTYIDDIIQGISSAIENLNGYDIFNLGESQTTSLKNLVSMIEKETGRAAVLDYLPMQEGDVFQTFADISKSKEMLHYNPQVKIADGIKNYIRYYLEQNK
jgi:UDP-glucuronate 4-epimerase